MPLYKTIVVNSITNIYLWKVEEPLEVLEAGLVLTKRSIERLALMRSVLQKRCFLAVRYLLKEAGYNDFSITYDEFGKPYLDDGRFISITHSFDFCGIIISSVPVGIDIEKKRLKIKNIASKFTDLALYKKTSDVDLIKKLTLVWGVKESVYKVCNIKGLSFKKQIDVNDFELSDLQTTADVILKDKKLLFTARFFEFNDFVCAYVF